MLSDLAALATAFGVLAAVVQLLLSRRQARAAFEHESVRRYWVISDDSLRQDGDEPSVQQRRYLRLCEDEFEVMRLGSIAWRTWEVWHDAIRGECPYDQVSDFDWLKRCLGADADHRGADCPALFALGAGVHSNHLSARSRSSPSRRYFVIGTSVRRWILYRRSSALTT